MSAGNNSNDDFNLAFKNAAMSVSNLYKKSIAAQNQKFHDGYDKALQDVVQWLSANPDFLSSGQIPCHKLAEFIKEKHKLNEISRRLHFTDSSPVTTSTSTNTTNTTNINNGNDSATGNTQEIFDFFIGNETKKRRHF